MSISSSHRNFDSSQHPFSIFYKLSKTAFAHLTTAPESIKGTAHSPLGIFFCFKDLPSQQGNSNCQTHLPGLILYKLYLILQPVKLLLLEASPISLKEQSDVYRLASSYAYRNGNPRLLNNEELAIPYTYENLEFYDASTSYAYFTIEEIEYLKNSFKEFYLSGCSITFRPGTPDFKTTQDKNKQVFTLKLEGVSPLIANSTDLEKIQDLFIGTPSLPNWYMWEVLKSQFPIEIQNNTDAIVNLQRQFNYILNC